MSLEEYEKQRKAEALEKQRAEAALQATKERIVGLAKKLPSAKDETTQAQRARLFSSMDANANGLLQLQEVGAGLAKLLGTQEAASIEAIIEAAYNKARTAKVSRSELSAQSSTRKALRMWAVKTFGFCFSTSSGTSSSSLDSQHPSKPSLRGDGHPICRHAVLLQARIGLATQRSPPSCP